MTGVYHGSVEKVLDGIRKEQLEYGISLGRRAPLHCMHVDCILEIVKAGLKPVIFIGSVNGPESPLYDPVRNPLTVDQQKEQFRHAIEDAGYDESLIITLEDAGDDNEWMRNLAQKLRDNGLYGKSVVHLRSKAADEQKMSDPIRPLSQYTQAFVNSGVSVWHSYNGDPSHDTINASDIRAYDLNNLTVAQRTVIAAPSHLISIARKARDENPDKDMLVDRGIPLTVLDLSFDRMYREAGIRTADVITLAEEKGDLSFKGLSAAATAIVEKIRGPKILDAANGNRPQKPLLFLGDSISPETAAILKRDGMFEVASGSIGKFQSGEPFAEIFYRDPEKFEINQQKIEGAKAIVVQSTAEPVGDHLTHLLEMIHTLKIHGAKEVTAVLPFSALARQDRKFEGRFATVGAELMPKLLKAAGADKVISFTMHSQASIGYYRDVFGDDFTSLSINDILAKHIRSCFPFTSAQVVIGAPDGADKPNDEGQRRACEFITTLHGKFNEKARFKISKVHTADSETKATSLEGDVAGKDCVVVDDLADGGSTLVNAAVLLKENGAKSVTCAITHAVLTKGDATALERLMTRKINGQYAIDSLVITDSIPEAADKVAAFAKQYPDLARKIVILPLGPVILAEVKKQLSAATPVPKNGRKPGKTAAAG